MGEGRDLLDRQRVEFGADQHGRAGRGAIVDERDAVSAEARHDPVRPRRLEKAADLAGGLRLRAGKFRRAVQRAPPVRKLAQVFGGQDHGETFSITRLPGDAAAACRKGRTQNEKWEFLLLFIGLRRKMSLRRNADPRGAKTVRRAPICR